MSITSAKQVDIPSLLSLIVILLSIFAWLTTLILMRDMDQGPGAPLHDFPTFLLGWIIMLTAMMLPSEIQYVKVYAALRKGKTNKKYGKFGIIMYVLFFVAGYGIAWIMYGSFAFILDSLIRQSTNEFKAWDTHGHQKASAE